MVRIPHERRAARAQRDCPKVAATVSVLFVLPLAGCYSHVVSEKGLGPGVEKIYEPNLKDDSASDPWNFSKNSQSAGVRNWKKVSTEGAKPQ